MSIGTKINRKLSRSVKLSCCLLFYHRFKHNSVRFKIKVKFFRLCSGGVVKRAHNGRDEIFGLFALRKL